MRRSIGLSSGKVLGGALVVSFAVSFAISVAMPGNANACGGCFAPPGPSTQVSAHRMALAISPKRTILWDQIQYVGNPTSFGWVLPIKSAVDVGVSSDQLFDRLESNTQASVTPPPPPECPPPEKRCITGGCDEGDRAGSPTASDTGAGFAADGGGV